MRSKLWIVTNELNIETRTQEVDFVLCICLKHVIGPFKIHHVNIYFTKRPFWSHTFHIFNNQHKYKYSAYPQANSDTLDETCLKNGTFVASLHVQIIYCLLVWTRYLKTCFQCIYIVSQMNWTRHVCLWIMFYVATLHYCQKLKHYLIIHAIVSQFKWIMDWRCSGS